MTKGQNEMGHFGIGMLIHASGLSLPQPFRGILTTLAYWEYDLDQSGVSPVGDTNLSEVCRNVKIGCIHEATILANQLTPLSAKYWSKSSPLSVSFQAPSYLLSKSSKYKSKRVHTVWNSYGRPVIKGDSTSHCDAWYWVQAHESVTLGLGGRTWECDTFPCKHGKVSHSNVLAP